MIRPRPDLEVRGFDVVDVRTGKAVAGGAIPRTIIVEHGEIVEGSYTVDVKHPRTGRVLTERRVLLWSATYAELIAGATLSCVVAGDRTAIETAEGLLGIPIDCARIRPWCHCAGMLA